MSFSIPRVPPAHSLPPPDLPFTLRSSQPYPRTSQSCSTPPGMCPTPPALIPQFQTLLPPTHMFSPPHALAIACSVHPPTPAKTPLGTWDPLLFLGHFSERWVLGWRGAFLCHLSSGQLVQVLPHPWYSLLIRRIMSCFTGYKDP